MPDTQHATGFFARSDNAFGASCRQGQRLLAEHMLAGGKRSDSHFFMKQVRGYDRNGIDIGTGEQCFVVANKIEFLRGSERRGHRRVDIATCCDFEARAVGKRNGDLLAPPPEPYYANSDHCALPGCGRIGLTWNRDRLFLLALFVDDAIDVRYFEVTA